MSYNIIKISLIVLFLGMFPLQAFAQYTAKDSFYFLKGDGVFSDEEKDQEAEYIKSQCEFSTLEQEYYDCSCIAGAYRLKRDEEKLTPQNIILNDLYNDKESKCVNTTKIAGNTFKFCKNYADFFRRRKTDNQEYCECVANKVAKKFTKNPRLRTRFINNLKVSAMSSCQERPVEQP